MAYKHKIVQALADLINQYGGGGKDPIMRAIWAGLKSQVPSILGILDENDNMVEEIRMKLMDALDLAPERDTEQLTEPVEVEFKQQAGKPISFIAPKGEQPPERKGKKPSGNKEH